MKSSRTIRVTKTKYRELAERAKRFGMGLTLMKYGEDQTEGAIHWGLYSPWAMLICNNAAKAETTWSERALISIASEINTEELRACGKTRPELDWSCLEDEELEDFIVWHEIGHRQDNFDFWMTGVVDAEVTSKCRARLRYINEILADRFAWEQIRPGSPMPITEFGKANRERIAHDLDYLGQHVKKNKPVDPSRAMAPGQYRDIPAIMLKTPELAGYIGPRVDPAVIARCAKTW